ncbi:5-oxoprolinase subunit PxpB [Fodinicola feengrottensis]|uniref:Allophanate hydrolase subunit 1 n=1 Tax=Fodinicola feengrottensis TaxID=435914 RepID=A0ABN2I8D6_9ACTN|nr:5-oxoprolinase subunit PxpB [Fodinicola feengrottensis]
MWIRPAGERAILVEVDDLDQVAGLRAGLVADLPAGAVEVVPAARTVLVTFDPDVTTFDRLSAAVRDVPLRMTDAIAGALVEIPVRYDGEDLDDVAKATGLSRAEVIARHQGPEYQVAFCGFAPGFGYLTGIDPALRLPRRSTPRTRVPAGSVAIAGEFTGVYPTVSPGGWHLLGHSELAMWDLDRDPPAALAPGDRVRFVSS